MKVGIRIPPCGPVSAIAEAVAHAEGLGYDVAWLPDSQMLWRDVYATATVAALHTQTIQLGTCVTNIETRHPSVIASALNTVQEVAGSRVICGIGTGGSAVREVGLPVTTRARMCEALDAIRAWQGGEAVPIGGHQSRLKDANGASPVYFAATGPKNLTFAGEVADGVILLAGIAPEILAESFASVRSGMANAGRSDGDVDFTVGTYCHVTDDIERDARLLKPICCNIAQINGQEFLKLAGIDLPNPGRIPGVFPDMNHAEDWNLAVKVAGEYVTDEMALKFAEKFCLLGTPDEIFGKIEAIRVRGAHSLYLRHIGNYEVPTSLMEDFASEVLPKVAAWR